MDCITSIYIDLSEVVGGAYRIVAWYDKDGSTGARLTSTFVNASNSMQLIDTSKENVHYWMRRFLKRSIKVFGKTDRQKIMNAFETEWSKI